jgi:hypothetical protein
MDVFAVIGTSSWISLCALCAYLCFAIIGITSILVETVPSPWRVLLCAIVMTAIATPTVIFDSPVIARAQLPLFVLLLFLYERIFLPGGIREHLFWAFSAVLLAVVSAIVTTTLSLCVTYLLEVPLFGTHILASVLNIASCAAICAVIIRFRLFRNQKTTPASLFFIISLGVCTLILTMLSSSPPTSMAKFLNEIVATNRTFDMVFFVVLVATILIFHFIHSQQLARMSRVEFEGASAQLVQSYLETLSATTTELRGLRHDLRNHVVALSRLVEKGDNDAAVAYLSHFQDIITAADVFVLTGSSVVNVILNAKLAVAQQKGVKTKVQTSVIGSLPLSDFDTVSLIGNLLDNAVEGSVLAAEHGGRPEVDVTIQQQGGNTLLRVENTAIAPKVSFGVFVTRKDEPMHGLGLVQVRRLVNDYDGYLDINFKPFAESKGAPGEPNLGVFSCTVFLPCVEQ